MKENIRKIIDAAKDGKEDHIASGLITSTKSKLNVGDHNILIGNGIQEEDKELFFGPLSLSDEFVTLPGAISFPHLMKEIGAFSSATQARKNGWDKEIPNGWSTHKVGKRHIFILKILI